MTRLRMRAEAFTIGAWRYACVALKQRTEERDVLIADRVADFLHRAMVALQHPLGGGNPQFLQIGQRAVTRRLLEAANEIANAHAHPARRIFQRKCRRKMLVHPFLRARDGIVRMIGLQRYDREARLPGSWRLDQKRLSRLHRHFVAAESFDEVNAQVQRRVYSTAAIES